MFREFVQRLLDAKNRDDAIDNVFYAEDGIDTAYQQGMLSWGERQMLMELINKIS